MLTCNYYYQQPDQVKMFSHLYVQFDHIDFTLDFKSIRCTTRFVPSSSFHVKFKTLLHSFNTISGSDLKFRIKNRYIFIFVIFVVYTYYESFL